MSEIKFFCRNRSHFKFLHFARHREREIVLFLEQDVLWNFEVRNLENTYCKRKDKNGISTASSIAIDTSETGAQAPPEFGTIMNFSRKTAPNFFINASAV